LQHKEGAEEREYGSHYSNHYSEECKYHHDWVKPSRRTAHNYNLGPAKVNCIENKGADWEDDFEEKRKNEKREEGKEDGFSNSTEVGSVSPSKTIKLDNFSVDVSWNTSDESHHQSMNVSNPISAAEENYINPKQAELHNVNYTVTESGAQ
jgi:hypothetical protein